MKMKYANEGMDCKKILLLFIKNIRLAVLAAVLGAALGGGLYLIHHVAMSGSREYQAESKLKLYFAKDESGDVYQAYNGYTWYDLMSTEQILNTTMSYLPDTYTKEEVVAATKASILSDIRILTITITASDPDRVSEILKATDNSLVEMGEREKEFTGIEVLKETEAKLLAADSRLLQAVLAGLVVVLVLFLIAMALAYVLDDRIYVPGDLKCITELPFVGFHFTNMPENGKNSREVELLEKLRKDTELNHEQLTKEKGVFDSLELDKDNPVTEEVCAKMRKADGVIIVIPFGKMDRTSLSYRIDQLVLQECKIVGIIIENPDMRFMKWYYNRL